MLARARAKLPWAHFHLHDLHRPLPAELERGYDRIVSAYVFHHFELPQKVELCRTLTAHLNPGGRLVIADLSFPDLAAMRAFAAVTADLWEEECYWLANDSLATLASAGLTATYEQVSSCAGIYSMSRPDSQEA
jgi:putative AdoMet-dependent methyltransferase